MARHRKHRKHYLKLFWRLYFYGLLLLIAVAVGTGAAAHLVGDDEGPPFHRVPERIADLIGEKLADGSFDSTALQAFMKDFNKITDVNAAVFDERNIRIAEAGNTRLEPLSKDDRNNCLIHRHFPRDGHMIQMVPLTPENPDGGYLLLAWPLGKGLEHLIAGFMAALLILALLPVPLARAIGRPLDRMTETARAIGEGDLSARTGLDRSDEIGELARTLDVMAARIATAIQSEKELLANVSHELRTPLARLKVALEMLQESEAIGPEMTRRLSDMGSDLDELEALIADVFLATKLSNGFESSLPLKPDTVDIPALAEEAVRRFARRHPAIDLTRTIPDNLPTLFADARLLRRLVDNLLENAAKYGKGKPVELAAATADGALRLTVRDSGPGVSEKDLSRLFEPFFQADPSRSDAHGGVGLGLTLCRRIAEAHGGSISAENGKGEGLAIAVTLPLKSTITD